MEDKINKGKKILKEKLELSKEVIIDTPQIIVAGKKEITIENHKGIITFSHNEIKVNTSLGPFIIEGESFEILYIASSTIIISGKFKSVRFEE